MSTRYSDVSVKWKLRCRSPSTTMWPSTVSVHVIVTGRFSQQGEEGDAPGHGLPPLRRLWDADSDSRPSARHRGLPGDRGWGVGACPDPLGGDRDAGPCDGAAV